MCGVDYGQQRKDSKVMAKVISLGTFDMVHRGHLVLFKRCRELAGNGKVIIGLNTDEFVTKYKGKPPIMTYQERYDTIMETGLVDEIIPNDQATGDARQVIKDSGANLIVVGSDWARKDYVGQLGVNWDWLDRQDIGIAYVNYTHGISTTELKRRIREA